MTIDDSIANEQFAQLEIILTCMEEIFNSKLSVEEKIAELQFLAHSIVRIDKVEDINNAK